VRTRLAMVVSAVFARKGELTDDLPPDMRARLVRISELIESVGLPNVKEPHLRQCRCRPTVKTPHRSWRDGTTTITCSYWPRDPRVVRPPGIVVTKRRRVSVRSNESVGKEAARR
jgi:hypothetical protein